MDYTENYMEIYEAVYFFSRITRSAGSIPPPADMEKTTAPGITESVYKAALRILVVCDLLGYDGNRFAATDEHKEKHRQILDIIGKNQDRHYAQMFDKALSESQFFFDTISELEYEIYSRCNFQVTFETGKEAAKHINLAGKKVLELGGNSGGFGTALLSANKNCAYTVVDTKIPCMVGNEFKESNRANITFIDGNTGITFIESNVFALALPDGLYDYVVIMNLLHDFDDEKCLAILQNCVKYCGSDTKFLIIEDILTDGFAPKEVVMHGLRLSVECRGGRQRTIKELSDLFLEIGYRFDQKIKLNNIHTMLLMRLQ